MMDERLKNRCVTCKHWDGDRGQCIDLFDDAIDTNRFLDLRETWSNAGECRELRVEMLLTDTFDDTPNIDGVFGCVLHEPVED